MEIKSKLDEDRIEIIRKEPEVGDLVAYNRLWDKQELYYTKELGLVKEIFKDYSTIECHDFALVHWLTTNDEEEHPIKNLLNVKLKEQK